MQHYLSQRANWEAEANKDGADMELKSHEEISRFLESSYPGEFLVERHPKDLRFLYLEEDMALQPDAYKKPDAPTDGDIWFQSGEFFIQKAGKAAVILSLGCIPDLKITHRASKRGYFMECKVQNDRGNAHERCAKYATPSILKSIQARLPDCTYHPIGYVFGGPMITKLKYRLELQATYAFARSHLLLWDMKDADQLHQWLNTTVVPLLRGTGSS